MKEKNHAEPVSDMAASYSSQASDMLKACRGCGEPAYGCKCMTKALAPAVPAHKARAARGRDLLAKAAGMLTDLLKANVKGYTKKDGTVVKQYSNKVVKTANEGYGFHGEAFHRAASQKMGDKSLYTAPESDVKEVHQQADTQFSDAANHLVKHGMFGEHDHARDFLDAKDGRHLHNETGGDLAKMSPHDLKKRVDQYHAKNPEAASAHAAKAAAKKTPSPAEQQAKAKEFEAAQKPGSKPYGSLASEAAHAGAQPPEKPAKQPSAAGKATGATHEQLEQMESSLANDEDSSDEELVAFFVKECGIPKDVAKQAVTHRDAFSMGVPPKGLLAELMAKDAAGKGGSADAGEAGKGAAPKQAATSAKPKGGGASLADEAKAMGAPSPDEAAAADPGGAVPRETPGAEAGAPDAAGAGAPPPHADANIDGWDKLPDDENPQYAMHGMGSKDLGRLATMKPEHAKAYAHKELANRGQDSDGNWQGFDKANAHHAANIPADFAPDDVEGPNDGGLTGGMQTVHGKVLSAAAKGHLNLQDRARAHLASRGHDVHGNWVGFDKAKELHGFDGKTGKPVKKPSGGGSGGAQGAQQPDLFKALAPGERPMLFMSVDAAQELSQALQVRHGGGSGG